MSLIHFHKEFKLQEKSFNTTDSLISFAEDISDEVAVFLKEWFNNKPFVEVKTSGSTGTPKIIRLKKEYMINSAKATGMFFELPEKTTALLCMSPNFIAGKMMLVRALVLGWHIDVISPSSTPLQNIQKKYDFSAMVPLQLFHSIEKIHLIKKIIVGGGVVSKELVQLIQPLSSQIFATYGMTETITHIAIKKLNNFTDNKEKTYYKTLPEVVIEVDERGCLVIDAPKISEKKIYTNDLVEIISENEFEWLGRFDSVINSGGIKLIPEQIESKIEKFINNRFFIAGLPDEVLGEKLILVIEAENNKNSTDEVLNQVKKVKGLNKFEVPKQVFCVYDFLETETGKIKRQETLQKHGIL